MLLHKASSSIILAGTAIGQCFLPSGAQINDVVDSDPYRYEPCDSDGHSMCCDTLRGDPCRDGLCWNEKDGFLWRKGCTDKRWRSPNCSKLCIDADVFAPGTNRAMSEIEVKITRCADGSYCCGDGELAGPCCQLGRGMRVVDGQVTMALEASVASPAPNEPTTPAGSTSSSGGAAPSNRATIIGGTVGGSVFVFCLIMGVLGYVKYGRRANPEADVAAGKRPAEPQAPMTSAADESHHEMTSGQPHPQPLDSGLHGGSSRYA
ncbi:hypothetical protein LZ30DRAFT_716369 [Colletotrichum cereale]|nr:hypothetical protein LZ30DRAFT_716369 [Colletotrichum cereale]